MTGAKKRRGGENGSYWISYSDMMAGMLFTFALILFMAVYQIVDLQQQKTAELETKEAQLSTQQSLLIDQESELQDKEELLASATLLLDQQQKELDTAQKNLALQQSQIKQQAAMLASQQEEIDRLIGMREGIIRKLSTELSRANLGVKVDENTGAIAFTGAVLFDVGQNTLKESGKKLLDAFLPVYLHTLMSPEYEGYIGEIIIEGHTDTSGTYLNNLELSQERALAVAKYCLSDQMGLTVEEKEAFRSIVTANGRSYADPIYDEDGRVDMNASRRVVFKFRMKDSEMIYQMRTIMEQ